jgi:hypothetical protein
MSDKVDSINKELTDMAETAYIARPLYGKFNLSTAYQEPVEGATKYVRADISSQWQPMETAPSGGIYVLVAVNDKVTYAAHYTGKKSGWWGYDGTPLKSRPTHWMLLPNPPEASDDN